MSSVTSCNWGLRYGGALNHANPGSNGLLAGATFPALDFLRYEVPVHEIVTDQMNIVYYPGGFVREA